MLFLIFLFSIISCNYSDKTRIKSSKSRSSESGIHDVLRVMEIISKAYYPLEEEDKFNRSVAFTNMIKSLLENLKDPYAGYLSAEDLEESQANFITGVASKGIGIVMMKLSEQTSGALVVDVLKDTPAQKAGIKKADKIVEVNGINLEGKTGLELQAIIRSSNKVNFKIERDEEIVKISVTPECYDIKSVDYSLKGEVGYIKLTQFCAKSSQYVKEAVINLKKQGANKLIFDLRDNGGGELTEAANIASIFTNGKLFTVVNKDSSETLEVNEEPFEKDIPLYVLINRGSASGSELVAAALKYNKRAALIGENTYGKGTMQVTIPLAEGSIKKGGIKFTVAEFKGPNGEKINKVGVAPDINVGVNSSGLSLLEDQKAAKYDLPLNILQNKYIEILKKVDKAQEEQLDTAIKIAKSGYIN